MHNNTNINQEDEAAFVDSFFLPGGILDDYDDSKNDHEKDEDQPFFVPPLPATSNPWDAVTAASAASPSSGLELAAAAGSAVQSRFGRQHYLIPPGLSGESLESLTSPRLSSQLPAGSPVSAPLPVGGDQLIGTRSPPGLTAEPQGLPAALIAAGPSSLSLNADYEGRINKDYIIENTSSQPLLQRGRLPDGSIPAPPGYDIIQPGGAGSFDYLDNTSTRSGNNNGADSGLQRDATAGNDAFPGHREDEPNIGTRPLYPSSLEYDNVQGRSSSDDGDGVATAMGNHRDTGLALGGAGLVEDDDDTRESVTISPIAGESMLDISTKDLKNQVPIPSNGPTTPTGFSADKEAAATSHRSEDVSFSPSTSEESQRPHSTPTSKASGKNRGNTANRGSALRTDMPGKIPLEEDTDEAESALLQEGFDSIESSGRGLSKWIAKAFQLVLDMYEIIAPVCQQMLAMVGFFVASLVKDLILLVWAVWNLGKYVGREVLHKDRSILCYMVLYLAPPVHALLVKMIDVPQFTPHVSAHVMIYSLCRQRSPTYLGRPDSHGRPYLSSGNGQLTNDVCLMILRVIRILLPLNFFCDGFMKEESNFMTLPNSARLLLAFLICMVRSRLILSPVAWVSWSVQFLAGFYIPSSWIVDASLASIGIATIHLVRSIDSENLLQDIKSS